MLTRLGDTLARFFRATAPDPFVIAILLTAFVFLVGVVFVGMDGNSGVALAQAPGFMLDAWQGGLWDLLAFSMQMSLILVTGSALASSPPIARLIRGVARLPRSGPQAVAMTALVAMSAGLINWGFGLIVGAILARDVHASLRERGLFAPRGLLAAAGYGAMLTWHGGLSGSATLKASTLEGQAGVLGADLANEIGAISTSVSIFGTLNLITTGGLLVATPLLLMAMCPKVARDESAYEPVRTEPVRTEDDDEHGALPRFLERSPMVVWLLAAPAFVWLSLDFGTKGLGGLTLNTAILTFFALGVVLHNGALNYMRAIEDGARGCAGIIIQFPLYAGIMGMMSASGLSVAISSRFVNVAGGSEGALASMTVLSAGLVNLFVPSGGGQWAVQGPIVMEAAAQSGASPVRLLMAVAYGDQLTNMLQPFWALPLLAICGVKARDVVGYTAVVMVAALAWVVVCVSVI
ncbi:MAG: TIGR00366 family protein [Planctomycetota bacterium]